MPSTLQGVEYVLKKHSDGRRRSGSPSEKEWPLEAFPVEAQRYLFEKRLRELEAKDPDAEKNAMEAKAISATRWKRFEAKPTKYREIAAFRFDVVEAYYKALSMGNKAGKARAIAAKQFDCSKDTLRRWLKAVEGQPKNDWLPLLAPDWKGGGKKSQCDEECWVFLYSHYLDRKKPTFSDSYRRAKKIADHKGVSIPSETTLYKRLKDEFSPVQIALARDGMEAARRFYPDQVRDKTCFAAGEAVSGDGLKFDSLWIAFEDGEILNTVTAWFWADIRTNYIMAWRAGKTENTDLTRLASYDLTAIAMPKHITIDNTRAAANKTMTGGQKTRYRFKKMENEPAGLFKLFGAEVHFTNPDKQKTASGTNPIERSFGIGGIHEKVRNHPRFKDRGFSKATAIPFEEFKEVLEEAINEFNMQPGRRTAVCNGRSFYEAFAESVKESKVVRLTEQQRRLFLMAQEYPVRVQKDGTVKLNARRLGSHKNRYYSEVLYKYIGNDVNVHFVPDNLEADVVVYAMDGRFICEAKHLPSIAFNSVEQGRSHNREKTRYLKMVKKELESKRRMEAMEMEAIYPKTEPGKIPEPGAIEGMFSKTGWDEIDGNRQKPSKAETAEMFHRGVEKLIEDQQEKAGGY